ncbi:hypothetical protein Tco_1292049 [Tanacetum coccineum]
MLVEMADMTKKVPMGIVENVLVKIDKFLFPSDFVVIDMLEAHNETMILGRSFLATIHAEINERCSKKVRIDEAYPTIPIGPLNRTAMKHSKYGKLETPPRSCAMRERKSIELMRKESSYNKEVEFEVISIHNHVIKMLLQVCLVISWNEVAQEVLNGNSSHTAII